LSKNSVDTAKQFIATEKKYLNLLGVAGLNSDWETVPPNFVEYYNEKMKFLNSMSQFLNQYNPNNGINGKSNGNWWNFGRSQNNKTDPSNNGLLDAWNSATSGAKQGWQSIDDDFGGNKKK